MNGIMLIRLNGSPVETGAQNICDLLGSLDLPSESLLVEHNGLALRREEWPHRPLASGDQIELVRIVAGG